MSKEKLPTLFISHGAPTMAIEPITAHEFLIELGSRYRDVEAVLCISAHWATYSPAVNATETPETIHDFSGFPSELYRIGYPARGAPDLARGGWRACSRKPPERAHPYPDHYMPLLAALGAAGEGAKGTVIHHSWYWGNLGMAAYEFDG